MARFIARAREELLLLSNVSLLLSIGFFVSLFSNRKRGFGRMMWCATTRAEVTLSN